MTGLHLQSECGYDITGKIISTILRSSNSLHTSLDECIQGCITFWGEIERQQVLTAEDPQVARDAVRRVAKALYDPTGGVIAQCEFGAGAKPAAIEAVFDEWRRVAEEHP